MTFTREWRTFIKEVSQAGAVIVGTHGRFYQLGNVSFWKEVPVDIFALHTGISDDDSIKPDAINLFPRKGRRTWTMPLKKPLKKE